jgi:hypothetical protein
VPRHPPSFQHPLRYLLPSFITSYLEFNVHRGQGESLVPLYTRERVSLSLSLSLMSSRDIRILFRHSNPRTRVNRGVRAIFTRPYPMVDLDGGNATLMTKTHRLMFEPCVRPTTTDPARPPDCLRISVPVYLSADVRGLGPSDHRRPGTPPAPDCLRIVYQCTYPLTFEAWVPLTTADPARPPAPDCLQGY